MRKLIKGIVLGIFYIFTLPFGIISIIPKRLFNSQAIYEICSEFLCFFPGRIGKYVRTCFYHQTLKESYLSAEFCLGCLINKMDARIGPNARIGGWTNIGLCTIGEEAVIANGVSILSGRHQHNFSDPKRAIFDGEDVFKPMNIGRNTFIGEKSIIMADIGEYSIIGAASVVLHEVPSYVVAVGSPVKVVKERKKPENTPARSTQ